MQTAVAESATTGLLPRLMQHPVSAVRHAAASTAINLFNVPPSATAAPRHMVCSLMPDRRSLRSEFV